jgi:hypothetical protein
MDTKKVAIFVGVVLAVWLIIKFTKKPADKEEILEKPSDINTVGDMNMGRPDQNNNIIPDGLVDFVSDKLNAFIDDKIGGLSRGTAKPFNQAVLKKRFNRKLISRMV